MNSYFFSAHTKKVKTKKLKEKYLDEIIN